VTDLEDPAAYPIATLTWMLSYREHGNDAIQAALRDFVTWAIQDGQRMAADLGYIPLPDELVERVLVEVDDIR
jgi:phosphate transport system substrate-binding protein